MLEGTGPQPPDDPLVDALLVGQKPLSLATLRRVARDGPPIALDPACVPELQAAVATIEKIVAAGEPAYGINTGFGKLAQTKISDADLSKLQSNLVLSHAAGTGLLLGDEAVRLILGLESAHGTLQIQAGHTALAVVDAARRHPPPGPARAPDDADRAHSPRYGLAPGAAV